MKKPEILSDIRAEFLHQAEELWNLNEERFRPLLEASRKEKLAINFKAVIDVSQTEARLDTEISYGGERFKEKVSKIFEDPDQEQLPLNGARPGTGLPETNGHATGEATTATINRLEIVGFKDRGGKPKGNKKGSSKSDKTTAKK